MATPAPAYGDIGYRLAIILGLGKQGSSPRRARRAAWGDIIDMAPIGSLHPGTVSRLCHLLWRERPRLLAAESRNSIQ